jgi:hypothetical protein
MIDSGSWNLDAVLDGVALDGLLLAWVDAP